MPDTSSAPWRRLIVIALLVACVVAAFIWLPVGDLLQQVQIQVRALGVWGPVLFIAAYVLACVLFVPGSALTLGAGALFGVVWGTVWVSIASTLGATASFLIGRHAARDFVKSRLAGRSGFAAVDAAVAREGWKIVLLTRLSPVFPFTLLNYAYGLTGVSLRAYVAASWLGMLPGTVLYVYLGSLGRLSGPAGRTTSQWVFTAVGLAATLAVTWFITRTARAALKQRLPDPPTHDS
jgi:uncharacterized membrane protein YdjX (TVP38/TMEM64 family)